jgi:hypothetical protein
LYPPTSLSSRFLPAVKTLLRRAKSSRVATSEGPPVEAADTPTPLKEAVEALNLKTPSEYFGQDRLRAPAFANDKRLAAVTTDEVAEAIRGWDRKEVPVADATYRIYEQIAKSKALPPRASLDVRDEWKPPGSEDKYEYQVSSVALGVLTGRNTGSSFLIREQQLDGRLAVLAAPGWTAPCRSRRPPVAGSRRRAREGH